jgi:hypothetical protein
VHLVWAPLGPGPLRSFLRSYVAHRAGAAHELIVVLNGASQEGLAAGETAGDDAAQAQAQARAPVPLSPEAVAIELRGVEHRLVVLEEPLLDLAAYGAAARLLEHERLCFLNSYSEILAGDWLGKLARAAELPDVGLVGATGSWESQAEWRRGSPRGWLRQLSAIRAPRRDYPRFPNPHVRTTAFMLERRVALELGLERARDKRAAYLLESGWQSITRQVRARGLRAVVVGRDGCSYDVGEWARSRTFRSGGQGNLLVADNRTGDWQRAPVGLRRRLSRDAWGTPRPVGRTGRG